MMLIKFQTVVLQIVGVSCIANSVFNVNVSEINADGIDKTDFMKDGPKKLFNDVIINVWTNKIVYYQCVNAQSLLEDYEEQDSFCAFWFISVRNTTMQSDEPVYKRNSGICYCQQPSKNERYCYLWQCLHKKQEECNEAILDGMLQTACVCKEESDSSNFCYKWQCVQAKQTEDMSFESSSNYTITFKSEYHCNNSTENYCRQWEGRRVSDNQREEISCYCNEQASNKFCGRWTCEKQVYGRDYAARFYSTLAVAILNIVTLSCIGFCAANEYPRLLFSRLMMSLVIGVVFLGICTVLTGSLGSLVGLCSTLIGLFLSFAIILLVPSKL
eukprot:TRINITY_DN7500_c0_g2_i1.p1 TRINITY_DN7500_c0_g2~~TRINITY_DN7500_c0_g2_i1.p1  ORF type:complete len:329 (+),score=12.10 TRINITY_DN7500_c0_g2_i1:160-1146(+)